MIERTTARIYLTAMVLACLAATPSRSMAADPPGASLQTGTAPTSGDAQVNDYVGWLQEQMRRMDAILERVRGTESPSERRDLMRDYAMALQVTNALTRALDPYLGIPALRAKANGVNRPEEKMACPMCPMMGTKSEPSSGGAKAEAEPGNSGAEDVQRGAAAPPSEGGHQSHH